MVSKEVLDRLQPIGVEAALAGIDARSQKGSEKRDQLEFALRQARYEAARAQRQYDAIDPDNRLVAGELERRWNQRLVAVRNLEVEVDQLDAGTEQALTSVDRERLMALGRDLTIAWDSPGATPETRKKITQGAPLQYCSAGMIPARIWRSTVMGLRSSILAASVNVTSPRAAHSPSM
jgi:hypothetical protein